jgi:hypothetical protein
MSNGFQEFGFGQNDTGIGERAKKFKGEKGKTYRIGFAWWPGMDSDDFDISNLVPAEGTDEAALTPKFIGAPRGYHKEAGYFINKGPEYTALVGEQPRMMVATLVVSWPLGRNGQPDKESLFSGMPDVMPWIFSQQKYEKLKKMHASGYWMHDHDVQIDCEDTQYQKFNFLPAKQNIFKEMLKSNNDKGKEIAQFIIDRVRQMAPNLPREIGADMTLDQLKEKLGVGGGGPVGNVVSSDADVDGLLGSMLDD